MGEKKKRKKRRSLRIRGILLGFGIVVMTALLFFVIFQTKNIEVTGNDRYTEGEIRQIVKQQEPLGFNTVLLAFFPYRADFSGIPFLESVSYEILSPSTVRAVVEEKMTVGYVQVDGEKAYFDNKGIVLECIPLEEPQEEGESLEVQPLTGEQGEVLDSESIPTARARSEEYDPDLENIPQVTGLDVMAAVVGERLSVENEEIFETLDALTRLLDRFRLWPEQVEIPGGQELILHYEGNIRVKLGTEAYLEEKISRLAGIMPQLAGLEGALHMENVDERNGDVVFSAGEEENDAQDAQDGQGQDGQDANGQDTQDGQGQAANGQDAQDGQGQAANGQDAQDGQGQAANWQDAQSQDGQDTQGQEPASDANGQDNPGEDDPATQTDGGEADPAAQNGEGQADATAQNGEGQADAAAQNGEGQADPAA